MKYIRTRNAIYEDFGTDNLGWRRVIRGNRTHILYPEEKIIGEANSIKKLCDEFVAFENDFLVPRLEFKNINENVLDAFMHCVELDCPNADLYGAIWTNKGLIYVAKINEKGELELL